MCIFCIAYLSNYNIISYGWNNINNTRNLQLSNHQKIYDGNANYINNMITSNNTIFLVNLFCNFICTSIFPSTYVFNETILLIVPKRLQIIYIRNPIRFHILLYSLYISTELNHLILCTSSTYIHLETLKSTNNQDIYIQPA